MFLPLSGDYAVHLLTLRPSIVIASTVRLYYMIKVMQEFENNDDDFSCNLIPYSRILIFTDRKQSQQSTP